MICLHSGEFGCNHRETSRHVLEHLVWLGVDMVRQRVKQYQSCSNPTHNLGQIVLARLAHDNALRPTPKAQAAIFKAGWAELPASSSLTPEISCKELECTNHLNKPPDCRNNSNICKA